MKGRRSKNECIDDKIVTFMELMERQGKVTQSQEEMIDQLR